MIVRKVNYQPLYRLDQTFWWCAGMRAIVGALLEGTLAGGGRLRALDAGSGAGALVAQWQSAHLAVGLDILPLALRYAQAGGVKDAVAGSLAGLPFPEASFDIVLCLDVLYHVGLRDSRRALAEIRRVLRPGGGLLVRMPAYPWLRGPHDEEFGTRRRFTAGLLRSVLEEAGFDIQRITYANTLLFPLLALRRLGRLGGIGRQASDLVALRAGPNRLLGGVLAVEARLLRRIDLPFGLSVMALARRPGLAPATAERAEIAPQRRRGDGRV